MSMLDHQRIPRASSDASVVASRSGLTAGRTLEPGVRSELEQRFGRRLLAHELTHTVQQRDAAPTVGQASAWPVSRPGDPAEREAASVARGASTSISQQQDGIGRQDEDSEDEEQLRRPTTPVPVPAPVADLPRLRPPEFSLGWKPPRVGLVLGIGAAAFAAPMGLAMAESPDLQRFTLDRLNGLTVPLGWLGNVLPMGDTRLAFRLDSNFLGQLPPRLLSGLSVRFMTRPPAEARAPEGTVAPGFELILDLNQVLGGLRERR